jgi:hypothetical protein
VTDSNCPHIKPLHVVFCDDIRREDNGKEILIGVYSGNVVIPQLPSPVVLATWMAFERAEVAAEGKIPIEFRMLDVSGNRPMGYGTMDLNLVPNESARTGALGFRGLSMMLTHPGSYAFQLKQYDEPWETIGTLTVEVRPLNIIRDASGLSPPS